jgi:hypothetical protein
MFTPSGEGLPLTAEQGSASLGCFDAVDEIPDGACNLETLFDNLLTATFDKGLDKITILWYYCIQVYRDAGTPSR